MKKFAMLAILFLLGSGAAVAQQDMGHLSVEGSGFTTGVVEATTSDSMTIRKDSGEVVTILLDAATVGGAREVGTRVRVDFHRNDQNRAIADEIQGVSPIVAQAAETMPLGVARSEPVVANEPATAAPVAEQAVSPAAAVPVAEPARVAPAARAEQLPATASLLPSLALLGLLAISGALALRAAR